MILTRSTRLIQPQGPVEIRRDSPLSVGLQDAFLLNTPTPQNIGRSVQSPTSGTLAQSTMECGVGLKFSNAAIQAPTYPYTGQVTVLVVAKPNVVDGNSRPFAHRRNSTLNSAAGGGALIWEFSSSSGSGLGFTVWNASSSTSSANSGAGSVLPGEIIVAAAVARGQGQTVEIYRDGLLAATASQTVALTNQTTPMEIGGRTANNSARYFSGDMAFVATWNRALSGEELSSITANPWQLFRPVQRRIYFDVSSIAPSLDHILTAESAIQQIFAGAGSVVQENSLAGSISVQNAVSSNGILQQVNTLIGDNSLSSNLSAVSALEQLNILQGNSQQTTNLSSDSSVAQVHNLSALSTAVEIVSSSVGILQSNILIANSCLVPNYSASGSIALVPVTDLSGNSVSQYDLSSSSNLLQDHILDQNASEQAVLSSSSAVVQNHVLISNNSTQIVLSSSGAIGTSSSLLGNNAQQTNTSSSGFIIQASFLQGNVVKHLNLSSSGAITQGSSQPLTDAEIRQMFAMLQVSVAKLQTRIDAVL